VSWKLVASRLAFLVLGALIIWALLSWRFIAAAGLSQYWYFEVTYPQKYIHFPGEFLNPCLGHVGGAHSAIKFCKGVIAYIAFLIISPLVTWYCARQRQWSANEAMPIVLLGTLGTLLMLEVATRLTPNRMDAAAIPSITLGMWLVSRTNREGQKGRLLCSLLLFGFMLEQSINTQLRPYQSLTFPGGTALFSRPGDAEEASWIAEHTRPGDYFFQVAYLNYYGLLKLQHPAPVDTLLPFESTRPEWVIETVDNLARKDVRYILWSPKLLRHVRDLNSPAPDYLDPLRIYMSTHYRMVKVFRTGNEIWERSPAV
jgi:hypothetical protein